MRLLLTLWKFYFWRQIGTEVLATLCSTIPFDRCALLKPSLWEASQFLTSRVAASLFVQTLPSAIPRAGFTWSEWNWKLRAPSRASEGPQHTLKCSLFLVNRTVYTSILSHQNWILAHRFSPPLPPTSHCPSSGLGWPCGQLWFPTVVLLPAFLLHKSNTC